jgi:hypothetical protein
VAKEKLGHPVPAAHQIAPGVLAGPDQVPSGLLLDAGNLDLDELVHPQQPRQQQRVTGIGLDPIPSRPLQL